ncbi:sulfotransferase [Falsiroseomonas sp.]|uniref:sulfotransferase n=1 Tax=Falsiroseomonas sp. TaxID=2870721 RepID=UPI003F6F0ACC
MSMHLLSEGRALAFLREADLTAGPCIFVHVPKTAGTSLRAELAAILPPDVNIHVDYTDTTRSFRERIDEAVERFLDQAGPGGIRFASGHIVARHVARIAERLPQARFITMLRDPVARVISDYRHQRSPRQPGFEAFRQRVPDLDAYLALRWEMDKSALHLVPQEILARGDTAAAIEHVARCFAFVGIQEMYDLSFRAITALAGRQQAPQIRANVNMDEDGTDAVDAATAARIRALNPMDAALYDHFAEALRTATPALRAVLG